MGQGHPCPGRPRGGNKQLTEHHISDPPRTTPAPYRKNRCRANTVGQPDSHSDCHCRIAAVGPHGIAVDDVAKNPRNIAKYADNPKVLAFYSRMAGMVGNRLEKMGDNSQSGR